MAVDESKAGLIKVKSDCYRAFIATLASETCFYLRSSNLIDSFFVNVSDVQKNVTANHGLLRNANIFSFLAQRISNDSFPKKGSFFVLTLNHRFSIELDHFL